MKVVRSLAVSAALALMLSACGGGDDKAELDKLDQKLGGKGNADPALTAALEDQIMVDPDLKGQANRHAVRPADQPYQAQVPPEEGSKTGAPGETLGTLAARQAQIAKDKFNGCSLDVNYSMQWANRLPADLPLPEKARVSEAAGSDHDGCSLRAVSYAAVQKPGAVAGYYLALARKAGYRADNIAEGQGMMVSGWRPGDGAAFYAILKPTDAGTEIDLVSNRGR